MASSITDLTSGGYDHNFVDNVKDFECAICLFVARDPKLIIKCGHSFCTTCLNTLMRSNPRPLCCPNDKSEFKESDVAPDKRLQRTIGSLLVHCDNRDYGCLKTFELRNLQTHLAKCNSKPSISNETLYTMVSELGERCEKYNTEIEELRTENYVLKWNVQSLEKNCMTVDASDKLCETFRKEMEELRLENNVLTRNVNILHKMVNASAERCEKYGKQMEELRSENNVSSTSNTLHKMVYATDKRCEKYGKDIEELQSENNVLKRAVRAFDIRPIIELNHKAVNHTPCKWLIKPYEGMPELWSPSFETREGHSMILMVALQNTSGTNLSIKCFLTSSPRDDSLRWPWEEHYCVTLIETESGLVVGRWHSRNDSPIIDASLDCMHALHGNFFDPYKPLTIVVKSTD